MPLTRLPAPFDHPDWIFELKYDGFRALANVEAGAVRLVSRKRNTFKSFPDLCATMAACIQAEDAVLDGEIVYLGSDGRPEFYSLMRRRTPQHFYAFDILCLGGKDLRGLPLVNRKQILRTVVPLQPAPVLYAEYFEERGVDLFRVVCESDLEGIVAKRKDGLYTPEETSWVKIKNLRYSQAEGRHELFEKPTASARRAGE
jgi:bifunctional non-homologous end joining protein LigD